MSLGHWNDLRFAWVNETVPKMKCRVIAGRKGGRARSVAKQEAARRNGRKGGPGKTRNIWLSEVL